MRPTLKELAQRRTEALGTIASASNGPHSSTSAEALMGLDNCVAFESILDVARSKSDNEIMVDLILSSMYFRFGGRRYCVRGLS